MDYVHKPGCPSPWMCNCYPTRPEPEEEPKPNPYEQTREPVTPPPGFDRPGFKVGQRVRVAFTTLAPKFLQGTEGKTGVVTCVVFCKSDGKTILYGVRYDVPDPNAVGGRYEGFELDAIEGGSAPATPTETCSFCGAPIVGYDLFKGPICSRDSGHWC